MTAWLAELGEITLLLRRGLRAVPRVDAAHVWGQAYELANRSILFVGLTMAFMGTILVSEAASQARHLIGDTSIIGATFLQLLVGEFGPALVALMLAGRYGAGAAAEIATMRVTEQVDALAMSGAEPIAYLVTPRLLAGIVGCIPITLWGIATAYAAGGLAGHFAFGMAWTTYFSTRLVRSVDVFAALCKTLMFGLAVPLMACRAGLQARGGAPGVGIATTRATVRGLMVLLFLDFFMGLGFFWLFP